MTIPSIQRHAQSYNKALTRLRYWTCSNLPTFTCSKLAMETPKKCVEFVNIDVFLVSLLLTLNRFYSVFCCFHCWLWISKCGLCLFEHIQYINWLSGKRNHLEVFIVWVGKVAWGDVESCFKNRGTGFKEWDDICYLSLMYCLSTNTLVDLYLLVLLP